MKAPDKNVPRVKSAFPLHTLPAVPEPHAATLLSLLYQLERSEWWSPQRMQSEQFEQLNRLLAHAHQHVPYYRNLWRGLNVNKRELSADDWSRLPVLHRAEVQKQGDALRAQKLPPGHRKLKRVNTSGSTGTPITVYSGEVNRLLWQAFTLREHFWHQRDASGTMAAIRIFRGQTRADSPRGFDMGGWGPPIDVLQETGSAYGLSIHTGCQQQLEWLCNTRPDYLTTFPTNAAELAQLSIHQNIDLPNLRQVSLLSETVSKELRELVKKAWRAKVVDMYSAVEVGYMALQCPEYEHYHVQSESVFLEVVDADGAPCKPGEIGRVLVSSLQNFAMPLIRYEIGDYAEVGHACPCGRGLPVLQRVLGRVRNMLTLPDGSRQWPGLAATFYRDIAPVIQHQIVQHSTQEIEARLIAERTLTEAEEQSIADIIQERLGHEFAIRFTYPERLKRSDSGKFEEFLSLIPGNQE